LGVRLGDGRRRRSRHLYPENGQAFEGFGRALDAALGGFALVALELGRALDLLLLAIGLDGGIASAGVDGRGAGAVGGDGEELERSAGGHGRSLHVVA
jgi:hypothetical protein